MTDKSATQTSFRHLLVLANPSPASFDHAIAASYAEVVKNRGQEIMVRDLYAIGFDPLLKATERPNEANWAPAADVALEMEHLRSADILVFVYPIWFGLPPAMLQGYVQRVMGAGYTFQDLQSAVGQPMVQGKPLISFSTSGTSLPWLDTQDQVVSLKAIFDVYLWRGLAMSRAEHHRIDSVVRDMSPDYAAEQLGRVRQAAEHACAMLASGQYRREAEAEAMRRARQQQN